MRTEKGDNGGDTPGGLWSEAHLHEDRGDGGVEGDAEGHGPQDAAPQAWVLEAWGWPVVVHSHATPSPSRSSAER